MCDQQSLRSACAYAQSDQSLCLSLEYSMIVKLLTEHHLEFQSFKGGCRGSSESTLLKMSNCWKSHAAALISFPGVILSKALVLQDECWGKNYSSFLSLLVLSLVITSRRVEFLSPVTYEEALTDL